MDNMAECPGWDARRELGPNTWSTGRRVSLRIYTTDRDTQQARQEVEQAYEGLSVPWGSCYIAYVKRFAELSLYVMVTVVCKYRKSAIKPPRGFFISSTFEGEYLIERGALFHLAKRQYVDKRPQTVLWSMKCYIRD